MANQKRIETHSTERANIPVERVDRFDTHHEPLLAGAYASPAAAIKRISCPRGRRRRARRAAIVEPPRHRHRRFDDRPAG